MPMKRTNHHLQRRQRLARIIKDEGSDAVLITNPVNVTYLTGFSGDSSYLVPTPKRSLLISDARFTEQIEQECPGLEAHIRPPSQSLPKAVVEVLRKLKLRTLGFESSHLSVAEWEGYREAAGPLDWKPGADRVEKLRAVKDSSELDEIREAIAIAERAFAMFTAMLRPEDREKDLSDAMEMYVRRAGGTCTSFPTIVAVEERAALPHAPPTDKSVADGNLVLVDWGAAGRFYKSDLTRVLATRTISPKLQKVYEVVLKAQQQAIRRIRPGATGREVDAEARSVIARAGFGQFFGHGLGHGIGLQVHEAPTLRQNSDWVLQPGMVVTVEPGIYLPGWGGVRIEDDVLVTPDGHEVLTSVAKEPIPTVEF
jgi:Xaa-Pro aminopeptidase